MLNSRLFAILSTVLFLASFLVAFAAETPVEKPNIIFVLADDLGIEGLSCYGTDRFKTPKIDALAQEGMRFTHTYAAPLCGPSRAAIMTGRYAFRTGATNQDRVTQIKPDQETMIPKVLKSAGYASASIGKWSQFGLSPADFGFERYLSYQGSGIYWNTQKKGREYLVDGKTVALKDKEYMPDMMHKFLVNFMEEHLKQPFFVYYSLSHVHSEILPTPDSAPDSKDLYADNIAYLDKLVGQLVAELERLDLRKKTLIIFVGDNGSVASQSQLCSIGGRKVYGAKGSMHEGGSLVPMIANWPGTTPAGKVSADLIDFSDFLPTFAALAGAPLPANTVIDGRSFAPQLRGEVGQPRDWIFVQLAKMWYVRSAGWKLNQNGELFDMSDAPFAEKPVAADSQDPAALAARQSLQAALAQLNPAGGILDDGDGSGRHGNKTKKKKEGKEANEGKKNKEAKDAKTTTEAEE
jgi:arylsulfatase A